MLLLFCFLTMGRTRNEPDLSKMSEDSKAIMKFMQAKHDELKSDLNEFKSLMTVREEKIDQLQSEISEVKSLLAVRDNCIVDLKCEVSSLKQKVTKLENLIDDEDAYVRRESLILSGTMVPTSQAGENCANTARQVIKDKIKFELNPADISVCHRLGPKPVNQSPDNRPLVVKLCRRDIKRQILFAKRDNADPARTLFVNESLTPKRRTIMYTLRQIKKAHPNIVTGCNTLEGRCFAYTKMPTSLPNSRAHDRKHVINTHSALIDFCREFVKKPLDDFLSSWDH